MNLAKDLINRLRSIPPQLYVWILVALFVVLATAVLFPGRLPSQLAMICRMFEATVLVRVAWHMFGFAAPSDGEQSDFILVWGLAMAGAGMSV